MFFFKLMNNSKDMTKQSCPICYCMLTDKNYAVTKCSHVFCLDCLLDHYTSSRIYGVRCPICRNKIKNNETDLYNPQPSAIQESNIVMGTYLDYVMQPNHYIVRVNPEDNIEFVCIS